MNKLSETIVTTVIAGTLLCAGAFQAGQVEAQVGTTACGEEREVEPGLMTEGTYRRLNEAVELMGEEKFDESVAELEKLRKSRLSDYEMATVHQYLGYLAAQRERYERAIEHFREAIRLDKMPNQTHFGMILQVAQFYNALERYDDALKQLDYWFCVSTEEARKQAEVWVLKASLHVQKDEYREALAAIEEAISIAEDPPEAWFRLKLGMELELEQFRDAAETLKLLVRMDPDRKEYWIQLSGTYMELGEDAEAMGALRLAFRRGLLDRGTEFVQLAGLLQELKAPRQAAEVLEAGLDAGHVEPTARNWEMVAGAWFQSRELQKALRAYDRAGQLSDSGKIDFQRASILTAEEDWEEVLTAANRALDKGDLSESEVGNSHLLIGMAHFNLGNLDDAEQAFNRAANYGKLRGAAREWLNHINQTRQRQLASS